MFFSLQKEIKISIERFYSEVPKHPYGCRFCCCLVARVVVRSKLFSLFNRIHCLGFIVGLDGFETDENQPNRKARKSKLTTKAYIEILFPILLVHKASLLRRCFQRIFSNCYREREET